MTKRRAPASFEQAITRIAGLISFEECARVVGKSERTVRNWSDPDCDSHPDLRQAFALDAAYRAAGGGDAPIAHAYLLSLELHCLFPDDADQLARLIACAAKETGEALAALIDACQPGAPEAVRLIAVRESVEGIEALKRAMAGLGIASTALAPTGGGIR